MTFTLRNLELTDSNRRYFVGLKSAEFPPVEFSFHVRTLSCGPPPTVSHAKHVQEGRTHFNSGEYVIYQCIPGFKISDDSIQGAFCNGQSNVWVGPRLKCIPDLSKCGPPPSVLGTTNNATAGLDTYSPGQMVKYECLPGYKLSLSQVSVPKSICTDGGAWGGPVISCHKSTPEKPAAPQPPSTPVKKAPLCDLGWFGDQCHSTCGNCIEGRETCFRDTGTCPKGCTPGYEGKKCLDPLN